MDALLTPPIQDVVTERAQKVIARIKTLFRDPTKSDPQWTKNDQKSPNFSKMIQWRKWDYFQDFWGMSYF